MSEPPPHVYFVVSAVFHYLGPSFAVLLFARVHVLGVAWLRIVSAALIFACWRRPWRAFLILDLDARRLLLAWGAVLAVMNCCFYLAISRLPLGTVAAIEFVPVIALAALGARSTRNVLALLFSVCGVYLLTDVRLAGAPLGFAFAFANAALFAGYIVLADKAAKHPRLSGIDALAAAMLIAAVAVTPIGGWQAARALDDPIALLAGLGVGVSSSVIPYVTDQLAMARLPRATYATLVALLPAFATIIGIVVLAQVPTWIEVTGVAAVVGGVALHRPRSAGRERATAPGATSLHARELVRLWPGAGSGGKQRSPGSRVPDAHLHPHSDSHPPLGIGAAYPHVLRADEQLRELRDGPARTRALRDASQMNFPGKLAAAAEAAMDCLCVQARDKVLVLCNPDQRAVAEVLAVAAQSRAGDVRLLEYPTLSRNGEEPSGEVARAMLRASVVFATTTYSISHTRARLAATAAGARIASMRGFTEAFAHAMSVDYELLRSRGARLAAALTAAQSCRITSAAGTDVSLSVRSRRATVDDGDLQAPGAFGNLPAGEAYIAPLETVGDGLIVFDGALADYGLLAAPLRVRLQAGRAVDAQGEAADWLLSRLDAGGELGRQVAEIGIGTNPGAQLCGVVAIDEKVLGTAHLAFGTSASFGGVNHAGVHIDGMIRAPTIEIDGEQLMDAGRPAASARVKP